MPGDINIINTESFIQSLSDLNCGKTHAAQINSKDFEIKQFETKPLDSFKTPEGFPFCCKNHKELYNIGIEKLAKFPNCCDGHKNLNSASWFNKSSYNYLPNKIVSTITYTRHCIAECIDHKNWQKEITDYIDFTASSYGQFPDGYGSPLGLDVYISNITANIKTGLNVPIEKQKVLLEHISNMNKSKTDIEQTDINLLISKYKEWLKIFPFEISFLSHLKPDFEKRIPILKGKGTTNIYSGITGFELKTKDELIKTLTNTTHTILKLVNTRSLFELGLLTEAKQIQIELLLAKRKLELEELDNTKFSERKEYIKLLKKWLSGEKLFLKELTPLIKAVSENHSFINDILDGIKQLQTNDTNANCIMNVRNNLPDRETAFRYWFKDFFVARYPNSIVTAEEEKGDGRIDLKIINFSLGTKIIEFKGWWNQTKANTVQQICSYLTDFEKEGYIFMINHNKSKDIKSEYKEMITQNQLNYIDNTWKEHTVENSDFSYFQSKHKFSVKEKTIYHFIFNVYFSNPSH